MPWRNSSMLYTPRAAPARIMAITAASQAAWNTGSFSSRSMGPKPCMPPRSCTPSIRLLRALSLPRLDLLGEQVERQGARRLVGVDPLAVGLAALHVELAVAPEARSTAQGDGHALGDDGAVVGLRR